MRAAIPRLKARIADLRAVNVADIEERYPPALIALRDKVAATISDIFGADTTEYRQFGDINLTQSDWPDPWEGMPLHVARRAYEDGIARTLARLETVIALLEEKLGGAPEDPGTRARRAFGDLDLHPEVARATAQLFEDGHYANAVEDACKVLEALVKLRSGRDDLSGTELMQAVFSPKNPILRFSDLKTESEMSEQQGMMFLYAGTMLGAS